MLLLLNEMHYLSLFKRYVLVLFIFLVCFFPLLAGRFSDFHLTQNRKKTLLWPYLQRAITMTAMQTNIAKYE